jgi:cell division protein FtsZ
LNVQFLAESDTIMINSNEDKQNSFFDLFKSNNQDIENDINQIPEFPVNEEQNDTAEIPIVDYEDELTAQEPEMQEQSIEEDELNIESIDQPEIEEIKNEENLSDLTLEKDDTAQSNIVNESLVEKNILTDNKEEPLDEALKSNKPKRKKRKMSNHRKAVNKDGQTVLPPIKVVGVGGGGSNAVTRMIETKLAGVEYLAVNTDIQALNNTYAEQKVQIGSHVTRGLGAGSDPVQGRRAADESREIISDALQNSEMVFVTACLGGGTGTGAAPVIAEVARELGALTIGVVTRPFIFEGSKRRQIAEEGIRDLQEKVDTLIVIPNDRLLQICGEDASVEEGFETADNILQQAIQGISELITQPGLVNLDFADVRKIMSNAGPALMAIGTGRGENRAVEAARNAIANPLLEVDITGSTGVLFNITGPTDFTLRELDTAARVVAEVVDPDAEIIFGAAIDENLSDEVRLTIIATGFGTGPSLTLNSQVDEEEIEPIRLADLQVEDTATSPSDLPTFLRKNFPLR